MGTKQNPGAFDCYASAAEDEPMFVLLARDKHAPTLVWLWATLRELDGEDAAKVAEARQVVADMMQWAKAHDRPVVGLAQSGLAAMFELIRVANHRAQEGVNEATGIEQMRLFLGLSEFERDTPAPVQKPVCPDCAGFGLTSETDAGREVSAPCSCPAGDEFRDLPRKGRRHAVDS